ncbi:MAG: endonuclease/exonuclease/phosphatase family protein [Pirellulaceae bacterium]|nr:endonuclease/exonuclease/phosphatase family protein [Pirellulaceae bacterium]MDP6555729.1 endonuclease/exonuclease/phosphatase family protein [Pirellulaceae bacterium]
MRCRDQCPDRLITWPFGGWRWLSRCCCSLVLYLFLHPQAFSHEQITVRFATFNTSLYRDSPGQLKKDLSTGSNKQAQRIAEVIQRVQPDVLLINEFDYDETGETVESFQRHYLQVSQSNQPPIQFGHSFIAPQNTGIASGLDLNGDGNTTGAGDAFGFGRFAGQYGMVVFSKLPIAKEKIRTFRTFLWKDMPAARFPLAPVSRQPFYSAEARAVLRLPSKSIWDLPIMCGLQTVRLVVAHPTPPVFDGPEDRNGLRNHDEIRLLADYIDPRRSNYIYDDQGRRGGLQQDDLFVVAGDMNADPFDGDSRNAAIRQLLDHLRVHQGTVPSSRGAVVKSRMDGGANDGQRGDPAHDTSDFANDLSVGNLRLDYVLASRSLQVANSGVFWPSPGDDGHAAIAASDHRLVWIDLHLEDDASN